MITAIGKENNNIGRHAILLHYNIILYYTRASLECVYKFRIFHRRITKSLRRKCLYDRCLRVFVFFLFIKMYGSTYSVLSSCRNTKSTRGPL
jgi:hypothetical protein